MLPMPIRNPVRLFIEARRSTKLSRQHPTRGIRLRVHNNCEKAVSSSGNPSPRAALFDLTGDKAQGGRDRNASARRPALHANSHPYATGPHQGVRCPHATRARRAGRKAFLMQLPPILQGDSLTRLLQGAFAGVVATLVIGFGWGGWMLGGKAQTMSDQNASRAVIAALAPVCADRFQHASDAKAKFTAFKAVESWQQDTFVEKGGWATFSGSDLPTRGVADACAKLLNEVK